ncbi:murein peptide amidase A, partial [Candidatus Kaiserbacteria bacterium]|nr:murein peptide amidase A [Candidatus Kaiserbacteria bacterium]
MIGLIFSLINKKTVPVIEPLPEIITPEKAVMGTSSKVIGYSVENRKIESFSFGTGARHLLFVGGIHGGYEWNSILLAYQFVDYLNQNLETIPTSVTIDVIPSINPDALYAVIKKEGRFKITDIPLTTTVGLGRFNAHQVDLNRNFACKWQPQSSWRSQ